MPSIAHNVVGTKNSEGEKKICILLKKGRTILFHPKDTEFEYSQFEFFVFTETFFVLSPREVC